MGISHMVPSASAINARAPPMVGSGIRIGTPAVTGRGMREAEMRDIAGLIVDGIAARGDVTAQEQIRQRVAAITDRFPVPGLPETLAATSRA